MSCWSQAAVVVLTAFSFAAAIPPARRPSLRQRLPSRQAITLPAGAQLDVTLARPTRLHHAGQIIFARLAASVYASNRLVLPAGTRLRGRIIRIQSQALWRRAQAAIGGEFSPPPAIVAVTFTAVDLPDAGWFSIATDASPDHPPLRLVASQSASPRQSLWRRGQSFAASRVRDLWSFLRQQRHLRVVKQEAIQSLPYHPTVLPAGTAYVARLQSPLAIPHPGPAPLPALGTPMLPPGLILHARLTTSLSSATAKWGMPVVAVLDRPVVSRRGRLLIPQGSRLIGQVTLARPARRLDRNGRLRFIFTHLQFPAGRSQAVTAQLQAAVSSQRLRMGPEGGVRATAPAAAPALALAVLLNSSLQSDADNAWTLSAGSGAHIALWGTLMAALISPARPVAMGLGYAASGQTVYRHFIARGHDVAFPAGTRLQIRIEPPPPHRPRLPLPPPGPPATRPHSQAAELRPPLLLSPRPLPAGGNPK